MASSSPSTTQPTATAPWDQPAIPALWTTDHGGQLSPELAAVLAEVEREELAAGPWDTSVSLEDLVGTADLNL
ncbi:hypothetical protein [Streptomyces sp. NPDC018833]|uniref:hypothetical protein n=1 Tax=Streptomyces sp. NPDC018833 TaxID=3365053 RepID=UPI00379D0BC6